MQAVGAAAAAAVVQVTGVNKGRYKKMYQSAISLLVTDFIYMNGLDSDFVVKVLAAVHSNRNRVS